MAQTDTGWSKGQRALLRFLEQQGVLAAEPVPPDAARPTNADLFAAFADAIEQQALVDLVSRALRIAPVDLAGFSPMPELTSLIPPDVARDGEVVPIAQRDGILEVAAANPLDLEMVKSVEFTTGLRVRTKIARRTEVCRALHEAYGGPDGDDTPVEDGTPAVPPVADAANGSEAVADEGARDDEPAGAETDRNADGSADPIRWSFDARESPSPTATSTAPAEQPGIAEAPVLEEDDASADASPVAAAASAGEEPDDDESGSGDGTEDAVPVYELDVAVDEDGDIDFSEFDDVQLTEPRRVDPVSVTPEPAAAPAEAIACEVVEADSVAPEASEPRPMTSEPVVVDTAAPEWGAPAAPEPVVSEVAREETVAPEPAPRSSRPAVLVVSGDLSRRVALREALEADAAPPCVVTMRDATEAQAVLGLGGITVVLVEDGALAPDGRSLAEVVQGRGARVVVWGGDAGATGVVALAREADARSVAARVRALVEEPAHE